MKHNKTGLFLMEMIVAILFFSLASALCIQLFTQAKKTNESSQKQDRAVDMATQIVERFKNDEQDPLFSHSLLYLKEDGTLTIEKQEGCYAMITIIEHHINIEIYDGETPLYVLDYYHHQQRRWPS